MHWQLELESRIGAHCSHYVSVTGGNLFGSGSRRLFFLACSSAHKICAKAPMLLSNLLGLDDSDNDHNDDDGGSGGGGGPPANKRQEGR